MRQGHAQTGAGDAQSRGRLHQLAAIDLSFANELLDLIKYLLIGVALYHWLLCLLNRTKSTGTAASRP
jgi:hypothetical protein